jgi:hypothetical protein
MQAMLTWRRQAWSLAADTITRIVLSDWPLTWWLLPGA